MKLGGGKASGVGRPACASFQNEERDKTKGVGFRVGTVVVREMTLSV